MRINKLLLLFCLLGGQSEVLLGQSLVHMPKTLSQVPKGASASNPFWQHLVLSLSRNPSAGNIITIFLPVDITIADIDGDGTVTDEISIDNTVAAVTGYNSIEGSTASTIVLTSNTGGQVGDLHIQFPITTLLQPATTFVAYGKVEFSNPGERDLPAGLLGLEYVEANELELVDFTHLFAHGAVDTTTNIQGDQYPTSASAALLAVLPDLVGDQTGTLGSEALSAVASPFADGNDSNDVAYRFWFSTTDSLKEISALDTTVFPAVDVASGLQALFNEGDAVELAFDIKNLPEDVYYLYMTTNLTGDFPLARSRGIAVQHKPIILGVGTFLGADDDYIDSGLLVDFDTGLISVSAQARAQLDIAFNVVDYDDSAAVQVFYSTVDSLADIALLSTTGTAAGGDLVITGLTGATAIDTNVVLVEGVNTSVNWRPLENDSTFVAAGRYFIYLATTDGTDLAISRSVYAYQIRHSPFFVFDVRRSQVLDTGGNQPQRYYNITWISDRGIAGDQDPDDSAEISLYYSARSDFLIPIGGDQLKVAVADSLADTHLLASNISEDLDGRTDNQFTWDLWDFINADNGGVPKAEQPYFLYALVRTDSTERLVRWDNEMGQPQSLTFSHSPMLRLEAPLEAVDVDGRQSFSVDWQAQDVDDAARIWIIITSKVAGLGLGESTSYAALINDGMTDWVANSLDGSLVNAIPLQEGKDHNWAVRPSSLVLDLDGGANVLMNGEYYVYVVIDPLNGNAVSADNIALRAAGVVTINGLGDAGATGLTAPALEILPATQVLSVGGDTARFEIRPHSGIRDVDLIAFFASVDTQFVRVVDQNKEKDGIQPFLFNPNLSGLGLVDTLKAGVDSTTAGKWLLDLVYFEQAGNYGFNGELTLATVELVAKDSSGVTPFIIDNFEERQSALYRHGIALATFSPQVGAKITIRPRARLTGQVWLQGRTVHESLVTFELRDRNSFLAISDSLFTAVNDLDSTRTGIQDSLAADGSFELVKIPSGNYQLIAHVDGFLDGQFPVLEVNPGDVLSGIDPMILKDGITQAPFLLGGDVTGFTDSSGASQPDNEIDQLDVDLTISFFGEAITAGHIGTIVDIDGDSLIWVSDLNVVAGNFGREGGGQVLKPGIYNETPSLELKYSKQHNDVVVELVGLSWQAVRAYGLRVLYDPSKGRLVRSQQGDLWNDQLAVQTIKDNRGEIILGGALIGPSFGGHAKGHLARLYFTPYPGVDASDLRIHMSVADALDYTHQPLDLVFSGALPNSFSLLQNYPNPFNPQTNLQIQMPYRSPVNLVIYDIAGQRIRDLWDGALTAGIHVFQWDGCDRQGNAVASGTYLARFNSVDGVSVRKMQLIR